MSILIGKMTPTAIVAALAAWCCWPYLDETEPGRGLRDSSCPPQIAALLLAPAIKPASDRDPFQLAVTNKKASLPAKKPTVSGAGRKAVDPGKAPANLLQSLVLSATYIGGNRRVALINGRFFELGEPLPASGSGQKPATIAEISAHRVLIQYEGGTLELKYPDSVSKAARSSPVEVAGDTRQRSSSPPGTKPKAPREYPRRGQTSGHEGQVRQNQRASR